MAAQASIRGVGSFNQPTQRPVDQRRIVGGQAGGFDLAPSFFRSGAATSKEVFRRQQRQERLEEENTPAAIQARKFGFARELIDETGLSGGSIGGIKAAGGGGLSGAEESFLSELEGQKDIQAGRIRSESSRSGILSTSSSIRQVADAEARIGLNVAEARAGFEQRQEELDLSELQNKRATVISIIQSILS